MPHGGAVHDIEPCRHRAPRPGYADSAPLSPSCRSRHRSKAAGPAGRRPVPPAGQRVSHSSEAQPGRRCRTRVGGVEGRRHLRIWAPCSPPGVGWPDSALAGLCRTGADRDAPGSGASFAGRNRRRHHLRQILRQIGVKSRGELTRLVVQRSADSQQGVADTGLAAGARERRLPHRVARPRSGRRSPACAAACRSAGPGSLAGTARQEDSDGSGTVALPWRTQARCPRQAPARGLARFGRRPRWLPRSPPRRQRTTACRTPVVVSELQPRQ
jgi:hypothetical protein